MLYFFRDYFLPFYKSVFATVAHVLVRSFAFRLVVSRTFRLRLALVRNFKVLERCESVLVFYAQHF